VSTAKSKLNVKLKPLAKPASKPTLTPNAALNKPAAARKHIRKPKVHRARRLAGH
jgi:hypothetical protein